MGGIRTHVDRWEILRVGLGIIVLVSASGTAAAQSGSVPGSAKALMVGILILLLFTLGLAYFFMKYGGDYETSVEPDTES
jgi:hypothetical protein